MSTWAVGLLVSGSANICLILWCSMISYDSGFSPLQHISHCQCVWQHTWHVAIGVKTFEWYIAVVYHYQFRVMVFLTILPVLSPHIMLNFGYTTHGITTILLKSFSTIKLQARVLATTVGFTKYLAKTQFFLLITFWEHMFLSYLAWGLQYFTKLQNIL